MPELETRTIVCRNPDVLATDIDGEIVLMSVERGSYYGLKKTARDIWELLEAPSAVGDLCEAMQRRYAGPATAIESDVRRFLSEMAAEGIVRFT
jgi:hypothetical protein